MFSVDQERLLDIRIELATKGFARVGRCSDPSSLAEVRAFVDSEPEEHCELNYGGTEKRVWGAERRCQRIMEFRSVADSFLSSLTSSRQLAHTVLAYSNKPVPKGSELENGRWHLDSVVRQLKVFLFLTATTENSGPLELVVGTHRLFFKVQAVMAGRYFSRGDLVNGTYRRYSKLSDAWIASLNAQGYRQTPLLCEAGDVFVVNTSSIHRARPCFEGGRYAVAAYY
jgi:hypothetical protein